MERFHSKMAKDLKEMIEMKVATNFCESTYLFRAKAFDSFCLENFPEDEVVSYAITLAWVKDALDNHNRNSAHSRLAFLKTLAHHQKAMGKSPYLPPSAMLNGKTLFVPYIFTDEELTELFKVIDANKKGTVFERVLYSTYYRLTYTCGLRPYESRMIKRSDVDLNTGEIRIINSKWNRSRSIIMSDDMNQLARKYATMRDMKYPDSEYLFPAHDGGCYTASQMQNRFKKFYELSRPDIPKELLPAIRVYDLRHRFATAVITKWLDNKVDINSRLAYLQTYMGHKEIASTAYYIHLLPENLTKSAGVDWKNLNAVIPEVEPWEE